MSDLLKISQAYVEELISKKLPQAYVYHGVSHTLSVVKACNEIVSEYGLNEEDREILLLAAWFHDTGYINGHLDHEAESVKIAREFLSGQNQDSQKIDKVCACIIATKCPPESKTELEQIICDADMCGLGSSSYKSLNKKLREEWELTRNDVTTDKTWIEREIKFLSDHSYFTETARKLYDSQKQRNIAQLKDMLENNDQNSKPEKVGPTASSKGGKKKKKKKQVYSRGVETMFRAGARTHINLSSMADSKANIMLSINAMILSVTLTVLLPKLDSNMHLIFPSVVLLSTCLVSIVFATLSTRPVVTRGRFSKEDIEQKRANLLFFGNFHSMDIEEYEWGVKEMMNDNEFLYGSLTRDLYNLGKVLNKKYRYLRICYSVFMYGLIASVIAFAAALLM